MVDSRRRDQQMVGHRSVPPMGFEPMLERV
jgi:hypothetical protein